MPAPSPLTGVSGSPVQIVVSFDGIDLPDSVSIAYLNIVQTLNGAATAEIRIVPGSTDILFEPGTTISISVGYTGESPQMIFLGNLSSIKATLSNNILQYTLQGKQELNNINLMVPDLAAPPVLQITHQESMLGFTGEKSNSDALCNRCSVRCPGSVLPVPGKMVELVGIGKDFSGTALVTKLTQTIEGGNWTSTIDTGNAADYKLPIPQQKGLLTATIWQYTGDPEQKGRIQVKLLLSGNESLLVWAYPLSAYARGTCLLPEIGDTVIVDSIGNDSDAYIILGSIPGNQKNYGADLPDEKNSKKSFASHNGIKIEIDDTDNTLSVQTPAANKIVISDKEKSISLNDQNGNSITLSPNGIEIKSEIDIKLSAFNFDLETTSKTSISAASDIVVSGLNINQTAQAGFTAKGNASAELSASGETTVKGAIVMIN